MLETGEKRIKGNGTQKALMFLLDFPPAQAFSAIGAESAPFLLHLWIFTIM